MRTRASFLSHSAQALSLAARARLCAAHSSSSRRASSSTSSSSARLPPPPAAAEPPAAGPAACSPALACRWRSFRNWRYAACGSRCGTALQKACQVGGRPAKGSLASRLLPWFDITLRRPLYSWRARLLLVKISWTSVEASDAPACQPTTRCAWPSWCLATHEPSSNVLEASSPLLSSVDSTTIAALLHGSTQPSHATQLSLSHT
mmetsp:Transcript_96598/g.288389  ORF Transcript_96598/g.288389 Transcript_96598/m.288389 type:complete len:205 (+) Transcript_96598:445-1059(+)